MHQPVGGARRCMSGSSAVEDWQGLDLEIRSCLQAPAVHLVDMKSEVVEVMEPAHGDRDSSAHFVHLLCLYCSISPWQLSWYSAVKNKINRSDALPK